MKKGLFIKVLFVIIISFFFAFNIKAAQIIDWGTGSSGSSSEVGSGSWSSGYVGLKVNIISKSKELKASSIFINKTCQTVKNGKCEEYRFATKNSKLLAASDYKVKWDYKDTSFATVYTGLPNDWCTAAECASTLNIHDELIKNNNRLLKNLLEEMIGNFTDENLEPYVDDYVLVEPMMKIGKYYGTAFELGKDFMPRNVKDDANAFSRTYAYRLFGGSAAGGLKTFYNTIRVETEIPDIGIKNYRKWLESQNSFGEYDSDDYPEYVRRNYCITRGRTCGRAIGVFSFKPFLVEKQVTITKEFDNSAEATSSVKFDLDKWSSSENQWKSTGKSCTASINSTTKKGSCTITGLLNGRYRVREASVWQPTCTSGCVDVTTESPIKFDIQSQNKSITVKNKRKYNLTINKKIEEKETITFTLQKWNSSQSKWESTGKSCTINKNSFNSAKQGSCSIVDLSTGTYRIIESGDWEAECKVGCVRVSEESPIKFDINAGINSTKTISIENKKKDTCESEFKDLKKDGNVSMENRIYLYNKYSTAVDDLRKLLDTSETNEKDVCKKSDPERKSDISCLSAGLYNVPFSATNLSNYNEKETIEISGKSYSTFCLNSLTFSKEIDDSTLNTYAGGLLMETEKGIVTKLNFKKQCYLYSKTEETVTKYYTSNTVDTGKVLTNYVDNIILKPGSGSSIEPGNKISTETPGTRITMEKNNNLYEFTTSVNYKVSKVYVENGSGRNPNSNCDNCKTLGYGILTKLNKKENAKLKFSFDTIWGNKNDDCSYSVDYKLIKNDLELEFRTISTDNPFPGNSGSGRTVGSNWCDGNNCSGDLSNSKINDFIHIRTNSYGIKSSSNTKEDPKYVITLTPELIREIRNYNKGKSYDDYRFKCKDEGNTCISDFLTNLRDSSKIQIYNDSQKRMCVEQSRNCLN